MKELLIKNGFMAYLIVLLFNAMTDIAHKITIQNILIKSFDGDLLIILSAVVNMLILLPFVFLFSPSGFLSDRYSKTKIIRYSSLLAIGLTSLITLSYYQGWFVFAFILTLFLAIQSAIYSPAKYAIIKDLVGENNLGSANAIVQAITIVAILTSSILFSVIFDKYYIASNSPDEILKSIAPIGWMLILMSSVEAFFAFKLPIVEAKNKNSKFKIKKYLNMTYLKINLRRVKYDKNIYLSIFALSIFWGVAQVIIASFPAHYKMMTGDDSVIIIQSILAISSIGIIIGASIAGFYSKKHIEHGLIPISALGLSLSILLFAYASTTSYMYLASILFGVFGGLFIVPLNATIQFFAEDKYIGKILAGNNFIQNIIMILFLFFSIIFVYLGLNTTTLFIFSSLIMLIGAFYAIKELPHLFIRILLYPILKTKYKMMVDGVENMPKTGGVLLLGNHTSWIDWLIIQLASPRAIKFVMERSIYNKRYLNWFLKLFDVIAISSGASRSSMRTIRERLDNGEVVALFPEGHISYNGQLSKFKKGYEMILKDTSHLIVPFYIRGLWGSSFSRADDRYKELSRDNKKRDIMVAFGKPLNSDTKTHTLKQKIIELSYVTWEHYISNSKPLQYQWLKRAKSNLFKKAIIDSLGTNLSNGKMITAVLLFVKYINLRCKDEKNIGIILPSSAIGAIVNMAIFVTGKRSVNLNYTVSSQNLSSAVESCDIKTIISSKKFIEKLDSKGFKLEDNILQKVLNAEDISMTFTKSKKIISLLQAYIMPRLMIEKLYFKEVDLDETATILFSSGSESKPKGIELTQKNLIANIKQMSSLFNSKKDDVMLNSLPNFHSFGLTATTLLPLCEGVTMLSVPDPTDAQTIGKMVGKYRATIIFGTTTFYRIYTKNRKLHPLMFQSIRMAFAGAEKLKDEVKDEFKNKFGITLYEGYGATETAPVVSVNMPDALEPDSMQIIVGDKRGSIGQPIPGTIVKIVDPNSYEELKSNEDGLILIGGIQVMKGYLNDSKRTAEAIIELDGIRYYKSGDKGHIDDDGFIYIVDRYSRFAKIGGEMVSLGGVEEQISALLDEEIDILALTTPNKKKGEQIVLLYEDDINIYEIVKKSNISPMMKPSKYIKVEAIPKLSSGKNDFNSAKKLALHSL